MSASTGNTNSTYTADQSTLSMLKHCFQTTTVTWKEILQIRGFVLNSDLGELGFWFWGLLGLFVFRKILRWKLGSIIWTGRITTPS